MADPAINRGRAPWPERTLVHLIHRQAGEAGREHLELRGKLQKAPLREAGITPTTWDRESVGYVVRR